MKIAAAVAVLLLAACSKASNGSAGNAAAGSADSAPTTASVGQQAPSWSEPLVGGGGTLSMSALRGKPLFIDFFATWCPPCNAEAPEVNAAYRKYASRGFQVVGVDVLENAAKAKLFVDEHKLTYPAVVDSGVLRDAYNINGMPVGVFIDRTGVVRKIEIGQLSPAAIDADIKAIL